MKALFCICLFPDEVDQEVFINISLTMDGVNNGKKQFRSKHEDFFETG